MGGVSRFRLRKSLGTVSQVSMLGFELQPEQVDELLEGVGFDVEEEVAGARLREALEAATLLGLEELDLVLASALVMELEAGLVGDLLERGGGDLRGRRASDRRCRGR